MGDQAACTADESISEQENTCGFTVQYLHQLDPTGHGCSTLKWRRLRPPESAGTRSVL